ncbi:CopD family protein [Kushneria aurantia]|uniref:Protoporphyrinogen IX oxidase n=1 Tax=Kushneria aurantia TaxID=504092 RepID=A0ABV6G0D1_9GAMM|nr:CopD family protein [Kushneria aurantia]
MYSWVLSLHIIAFVAWFAGLLYLPRLFLYHVHSLRQQDEQGASRFQVMERKLYRAIMNPAMIATLVFGIWLAVLGFNTLFGAVWFYLKLLLVVALIGYQHVCLANLKRFAAGTNRRGRLYFRVLGMIPALLLIAIVVLSVVRPW